MLCAAMCLVMMAGRPANSESAGTATIAVDMDPATPGIQTTLVLPASTPEFSIDVVVENADAIGAFEFWLGWDNIGLQFLGWSEGPFLGSTGRATSCFPQVHENSLRLGCASS